MLTPPLRIRVNLISWIHKQEEVSVFPVLKIVTNVKRLHLIMQFVLNVLMVTTLKIIIALNVQVSV